MSIYKRFRDSMGWTQAQLADALGVQRSAVTNYEAGHVPRRDVAYRFLGLAQENEFQCSLEDVQPPPEQAVV